MHLLLALIVGVVFAGTGMVMGYVAPIWSALLTLIPLVVIGTTASDPPLSGLVLGTAAGIAIRIGTIVERRRARTRLPVARLIR